MFVLIKLTYDPMNPNYLFINILTVSLGWLPVSLWISPPLYFIVTVLIDFISYIITYVTSHVITVLPLFFARLWLNLFVKGNIPGDGISWT